MAEGNEEARRHETIHRLVNNRNNLEALFLRRTLVSYEKELFIIIKRLDDEKLDWMEFTKRIRHCESDAMPEFEWVYKTIREHPPSPIELCTPACIRAEIPFPMLSPSTRHSLVNHSGAETANSIGGGGASSRVSRTAKSRDQESRLRHEAMKEDLRGDHTVTRKDADLDKLVVAPTITVATHGGRDDVLTKLPLIQVKAKSSRNQRTAASLGPKPADNPTLLRSSTDVESGRRAERLTPLGGATGQQQQQQQQQQQASGGHDRSHLSASDIPDTVFAEARDFNLPTAADGRDSRLTPRLLSDRRRGRKARSVKPLGERVGDFYKRFDTWLVEGSKPSSEEGMADELHDSQTARDQPRF